LFVYKIPVHDNETETSCQSGSKYEPLNVVDVDIIVPFLIFSHTQSAPIPELL